MKTTYLAFDSLPEPGDRFLLGDEIATGAWGKVKIGNVVYN